MVNTKLIIGMGAFLLIIASTLLLTTSSSRCTEGWLETDQSPIYYCESRDIYRACERLSGSNITCYHIGSDVNYTWVNQSEEVVTTIGDVMKVSFEPDCVYLAYGSSGKKKIIEETADGWILDNINYSALRECDSFQQCNFPYFIAYEDCNDRVNGRYATSEVIR